MSGQYEGGRLVYRSEVGTKFDDDCQSETPEKLLKLGGKNVTIAVVSVEAHGTWISPRLVAETAFAELTPRPAYATAVLGSARHHAFRPRHFFELDPDEGLDLRERAKAAQTSGCGWRTSG